MMKINNVQPRSKWKLPLVIVVIVAVVAVGAVFIHARLDSNKNSKQYVSAGQNTKGEQSDTKSSGADSSSTSSGNSVAEPGDSKSSTGSSTDTSSTSLIDPSGDFVSAHTISLADHPSLTSVCNTSPGASCKIVFTNGSTSKSLPLQTTDRGGSTYWNSWTPSSIGLAAGNWQIQAIASINGQTKSSADALPLKVSE